MLTVSVTGYIDGLRVIDRRLDALVERISDARPAWPEVLRVFQSIAADTFRSEGAANAGGVWPPLAPRTNADRIRQGYPPEHPILRRSGDLERSVTSRSGDTILVQTPTYFAVGTAVPYVVYHQSRAPRKRLPRRAVVDLTTDQRHEILRPLRQWLTGLDPVGRKQTAAP